MTPQERALHIMANNIEDGKVLCSYKEFRDLITAQISEAEREAVRKALALPK